MGNQSSLDFLITDHYTPLEIKGILFFVALMNTKKILITWGLGYIGSHTATLFSEAGYEVVLVDNLSNTHKESALKGLEKIIGKAPIFYEGDVRDSEFMEKIFEQEVIDGVIHFAAKKAVGESCYDPFLYYDNNIIGTLRLLEVMEKYQVKNLIFSSSATVYDPEKNVPPFTENDRLNTTNPYGTTKLVIEYLLKDMSRNKGFSNIILRYFNPIWAHESGRIGENPKGIPTNLLPYMLKVANHEIETFQVFGDDYNTPDGTCIRDYIHIMDIAEAHLRAYEYLIERKEAANHDENLNTNFWEVFNIGTGNGKSVKEMIHIVNSVIGEELKVEITERRDGDVAVSLANPEKAKQALSREPKRSIVQAIQDAWDFYTKTKHL